MNGIIKYLFELAYRLRPIRASHCPQIESVSIATFPLYLFAAAIDACYDKAIIQTQLHTVEDILDKLEMKQRKRHKKTETTDLALSQVRDL